MKGKSSFTYVKTPQRGLNLEQHKMKCNSVGNKRFNYAWCAGHGHTTNGMI